MADVIHVLGWLAAILMIAHSYYLREQQAPGKEHRAELPALGYGLAMLAVMTVLLNVTGVA